MRLSSVIGVGETPSADESADGLTALNALLDALWNERLMVYAIRQDSATWASGNASRTVGTGGNIAITRPQRVENVFFRDSANVDHPVEILRDRQLYDAIPVKATTSSYPQVVFYDPAYPLATMYAYPVPSQTLTVYIDSWQQLQSFSALTTDVSLPPGYEDMLAFNLAVSFAPEFGAAASLPPWVVARAMSSKAVLKRLNAPANVMQVDSGVLMNRFPLNVYTDG